MKTPFGPPLDSRKLYDYLETHSPQQMADDTKNWNCDATDLLAIADVFNYRLSQPEYAVVLYEQALEILNKNPNLVSSDTNVQGAYASYGAALMGIDDYEKATNTLLEAKRLDPNDYLVVFNLAYSYYYCSDFKQAKVAFDNLVNADEEYLRDQLSYEQIENAGKWSQLLSNPKNLIDSLIDSAESHHSQANNLFSSSNYEEALNEYEDAIKVYERLLKTQDDYTHIADDLKKSIKEHIALAYLDMSSIFLDAYEDNISPAIELLLKSLMMDKTLEDAKKNLLYCIDRVNKFLKVAQIDLGTRQGFTVPYNKAFDALKTPSPEGTDGREWQSAIKYLKEAEAAHSGLAVTHHLLGLAYEGNKEDEMAIDEWGKAFQINPKFDFETRIKLL